MHILTINNKRESLFLKQKTKIVDIASLGKTEIREVIREMRLLMKKADGVGLSANQVGLSWHFFVAEVPTGKGAETKFYAVFNPEIIKKSENTVNLEEGCLSIPDTFGLVERPEKITLIGFDPTGKKLKIKAWGLLARVFQHELDHLNGVLFVDKAKDLHAMPTSERLKEREKRLKEE